MRHGVLAAWSLVCLIGQLDSAGADEVRTVEIQGIPYRETYRTVQTPVAQVEWESREVTEYVEQHVTEMREWDRTVHVPRVRYEWQPRLRNRWNVFAQPYWAYELVPRTAWETRVEKVRAPVAYRRVVPEKRIVQTPKRSLGFEQRRELVSRVPIVPSPPTMVGGPFRTSTPASGSSAAQTARRIGGVQRYDGALPRRSATTQPR